MVEVAFDDEATATNASSKEEVTAAEASTDEDTIFMDELEAAEATVASASNSRSVERASDEHTAIGAVTSVVRAAEAEVIALTSSSGTT